MAITKLGNSFARVAGNVGRDMVNPFNVGLTGLQAATGDMSVGEAVAGSAAGSAGFNVARHSAETKLSPKLVSIGARASSASAPIWKRALGAVASRVGSKVSMLGWAAGLPAAMVAASAAMPIARKYAPIYKRKSPEQVAAERVPLVQG